MEDIIRPKLLEADVEDATREYQAEIDRLERELNEQRTAYADSFWKAKLSQHNALCKVNC